MNKGFSEEVQEISTNGFHQSEVLLAQTLHEIHERSGSECSHLLYGAILHTAGAIKFIATLIAKGNGPEKTENTNKETMLAAGLILARTVQSTSDGVAMDFSPRNILAAITAANKIAGEENFERHFDPDMMNCFKEGCESRGVSYENYWDDLRDVGPSFEGFSETLANYNKKTRH
jgi:hypothetical protein